MAFCEDEQPLDYLLKSSQTWKCMAVSFLPDHPPITIDEKNIVNYTIKPCGIHHKNIVHYQCKDINHINDTSNFSSLNT